MTPSSIEVTDDGRGRPGPTGSGLAGLAERAGLAGGHLEAGPDPAGGYRLRLTVPAAPAVPAAPGGSRAGLAVPAARGQREVPRPGSAPEGAGVIRVLLADDQSLVRGRAGRRCSPWRPTSTSSPRSAAATRWWPPPAAPPRCRAARRGDARPGRHRRGRRAARRGAGRPGGRSSPPSAGPATCAGRWRPARSASWSRTRRPASWPPRSAPSPPGARVVDPALAAATLAGGASPLTGRERDVLVAARDGATVADIAGRLFLSEGTVRNYLSAAISKTGTRNRVEALRTAETNGWL